MKKTLKKSMALALASAIAMSMLWRYGTFSHRLCVLKFFFTIIPKI